MEFKFPKKLPKEWARQLGKAKPSKSSAPVIKLSKGGGDPNFGYETIGTYSTDTSHCIRGSVFTIPQSGTAESITAYVKTWADYSDAKVVFAIYKHSDLSFVGMTEIWTIGTTANQTLWKTLNFITPKPNLEADTAYVLVGWGDNESWLKMYYDTTGETNQGHNTAPDASIWEYGTPPDFPDPITFNHNNYLYSIYCSYTAGAIMKEVSDSVSLSEMPLKGWTPLVTDSVGLSDTIIANKPLLQASDGISFVDTVISDKSLGVADGVLLSDTPLKILTVEIADSIGFSDLVLKGGINRIFESVYMSDQVLCAKSFSVLDSVGLLDVPLKDWIPQIIDEIALTDIPYKHWMPAITDNVNLSDEVFKLLKHTIIDSIGLSEIAQKSGVMQAIDALTLSEQVLRDKSFFIGDVISLADAILRDKNFPITDSISLTELVVLIHGILKHLFGFDAIVDDGKMEVKV